MTAYDAAVLADNPVAYLPLSGRPVDVTGRHQPVVHGAPRTVPMPDGSWAYDFNGLTDWVDIPSAPDLSVTATGEITIEAWIAPSVLDFVKMEGAGYVYFAGKGTNFGTNGDQEYGCRIYSYANAETPPRPNRISGYCFNPAGGQGAGSYFQDPVQIGQWIHYALSISIPDGVTRLYKDGVLRDTDPLSGYNIIPKAGGSPLRIGTMNLAEFFQGGIGRVAVYPTALPAARLAAHHAAMPT